MTIGVGGSTVQQEMQRLSKLSFPVIPIQEGEYRRRCDMACKLMQLQGISAVYLNAGTNLYYFTGLRWNPSERMVGAVLLATGELWYIAPHFELDTLRQFMLIDAPIIAWQEHESPYLLLAQLLQQQVVVNSKIGVDESTPFFIVDGLMKAAPQLQWCDSKSIVAACRMRKSAQEIALMQSAKSLTLEVQRSAAAILHVGISRAEVAVFIDQAHRLLGAASGSYFCIVLFAKATSFPHGVNYEQALQVDDWVLIDTGCQLEGYNSDITRSYCFGTASPKQRQMWQLEKQAQIAAFDAAQLGSQCELVDLAARRVLESAGLGPDYQLPGLPHRTGHGCGLDIHEWPYLVKGDQTPLDVGMVFSNEPMIVIPDEFGVRLEDHFYMSSQGPRWFTQPSYSVDDPFGLES
ncbi:aminopeptidase P family protein [Alginatibacterium sediminis]|uniref:Aminopeptidase P family protein n=1 Tax=Alginatibacterium sediminis TaxID=2164068 RepID=A0A420EJK6_9ALTE|nr:Xaa-Pro peptidase family protein [Alginatibacterium sediminis]RKF20879.1 aminopeptidase P family protein [Alginatibacterium sediminis]